MQSSILQAKTVLVVDDEPLLRSAIAFDFKRRGCRVLEAATGSEAYEVVKANVIDAVVSDVRMPNGDGIELLKRISLLEGFKPVVVLLTGFADLTEADAIALGARGLLEKPIDRKLMMKVLEEALEKKP